MRNSIFEDIKSTFSKSDDIIIKIIYINIAVFLAVNIARLIIYFYAGTLAVKIFPGTPFYDFLSWLAVPASLNKLILKPWTLLSYMFLQVGIFHILVNMLILYWFGKILKEFIGNKRILPVYILGGIAGGLLFILSYNIFPVFQKDIADSFCLGASAGVLATVIAAATIAPNYSIYLFLLGPIKLLYIALFLIILDVLSIPTGINAGGHIAHLGGAIFGFYYIKQLQKGSDIATGFNKFINVLVSAFSSKRKIKVEYKRTGNKKTFHSSIQKTKQEKIDAILDKIAQSGYDSLTREEKDFLFKASKEN